MKRLIATLLMTVSVGAMAHGPHGYHYGGYHHGGGGWGWVAPALIGGAVVYAATRPPVVVQQPPVVVQQPPVVIQQNPVVVQGQNCSPWTQVQNPDGSITTTRTCTQ